MSPETPPPPAAARTGRLPTQMWPTFAEEFRSLRTKVGLELAGRREAVLLVTSAVPREGKSTVALNLAHALARAGRSTVLVDGDLRHPDVHRAFGVSRAPGFAELLEGRCRGAEVVLPTDCPGLFVVTAGGAVASPAELLSSETCCTALRELASGHEFLVLDSPPIVSITDTQLLSRCVDGVLFVVRGRETPREIAKEALEHLHDGTLLGVVVNGLSTPRRYGYY